MSIAQPIDVITPATTKRQQLAQSIQALYMKNKGTQKQAMAANNAALRAFPLFGGAGARDSTTLPPAPLPQVTVPYLQDQGTSSNLGVVNPGDPGAPTASQAPGQAAPGFPAPDAVASNAALSMQQSPSAPQSPSMQQSPSAPQNTYDQTTTPGQPAIAPRRVFAGQGLYADGSQAPQPTMDPNQILQNYSYLPSVRRLIDPSALGATFLPRAGVGNMV